MSHDVLTSEQSEATMLGVAERDRVGIYLVALYLLVHGLEVGRTNRKFILILIRVGQLFRYLLKRP